ncbi:CotH kinase family protein [Flavobacterium sp.]|uniref:CotH kinase family protein n=1 Tax=Flavobacterium sp. TaxID=239 RepID=UPI002B4B0329|nr:CotH kinase family protein [Flavobacterium sp.]HLF51742.1 CotH kinase family protein [Flavobacterium sp.]
MKKSSILLFILFFLVISNAVLGQNIVINEILTANTITNTDEDGTHQDWIELYNNGATTVNLSGYGLSDDVTFLYKWVFPNVSVAPGQYLLVWASDKNRTIAGSPLHTNFKISSSGEVISLTNPSGVVVNTVPATVLLPDVSYGRLPNGTGGFIYFENTTPNAVNSTVGYAEILNPPSFSQNSGFFATGFNLTLSSTTPGTTILYTLDGSEPESNNIGGTTYSYKNQYPESPGQVTGPLLQKNFKTLQYSAPVSIIDRSALPNKIASISSTYHFNPTYIPVNPIYKGTVVRAKAVKPGALSSKVASKSYFIAPQGSGRFTLPVVSLSINENEFFDYTNGTYVAGVDFDNWRTANPSLNPGSTEGIGNYYRLGDAYERVANMAYFVNGAEVLNQDVGIQIHGGGSRILQSKSLRIYARSDYGANSMDYKFFSDVADASFKRLVLRNSGADFSFTMFRDALNQELIKSLHAETEAYQPTVTFINGEYWGILNIREKYSDSYFARVYNFGANELDYVENEDFAQEGDNIDYLNMINYVQNNSLASATNYTYIKTRLDPESFKDNFIANIFLQNSDWPGNNVQCWRKRTTGFVPNAPYGHDGRWRWAIHDMDNTFSFGTSAGMNANTLALATASNGPEYPNPPWSTLLLRKLLENNTFKIEFINRFADLLNTSFLSTRIISTMNEMKSVIEPEMGEHISRWKTLSGVSGWNSLLAIQTDFANQRPAIQRNHIRLQFGISSNINATLNVSDPVHGYIKMNTIDIVNGTPGITGNPYPWTGIYFHNIPVTLKAVANSGLVFSHWSGASTSTNAEITLTPTANFSITAHFIQGGPVETIVPIYFWMMDDAIVNNVPLESLNSTYELGSDGVIQYQSCLVGYPFTATSPSWRKSSMERRNNPTPINYRPIANGNLPYDVNVMKGLQIKQSFQSGGLENTMVFNISTVGYKKINLSFAAMDELAGVTGIVVDYAVNSGTPVWLNTGLMPASLLLTNAYQLFQIDFSPILTANNNPNFKVRLRFTGPDMTLDAGNRVTFNNIAVDGVQQTLDTIENETLHFKIFPNPFSDIINITGIGGQIAYKIFTIDGKMIREDILEASQINLSDLSKGMYLLQLSSESKVETKKIIKK